MAELKERILEAAGVVRSKSALVPRIGVILGTGLGALADRIQVETAIPYGDIPHFPLATVEEHRGEVVLGTLAGKPVVAFSGRVHCYEGYSMQQVTFPVRVAAELGVTHLVVSNAAGGLNPQFKAGDLMVITDHINFMGDNPLVGPNDESLGPRYPDMCEPYAHELIELAEDVAMEQGIRVRRGVYLACMGPCLETRAEYRMMRFFGADAVGMSTVPEVIVAVHAGLRVLGFSAITDECLPDALEPVDIERIIAVANAVEPKLAGIVESCIGKMEP